MKSRERTIVLSVRCDIRDVSVVALWLNENKSGAKTVGEVGRRSIEMLSDMIKAKDPERYAHLTTADALHRLEKMGLKRGTRNTYTLVKRLELEDVVLEQQPSHGLSISEEIARDIQQTTRSGSYSKEEMQRITDSLGGIVDGETGGDAEPGDKGTSSEEGD